MYLVTSSDIVTRRFVGQLAKLPAARKVRAFTGASGGHYPRLLEQRANRRCEQGSRGGLVGARLILQRYRDGVGIGSGAALDVQGGAIRRRLERAGRPRLAVLDDPHLVSFTRRRGRQITGNQQDTLRWADEHLALRLRLSFSKGGDHGVRAGEDGERLVDPGELDVLLAILFAYARQFVRQVALAAAEVHGGEDRQGQRQSQEGGPSKAALLHPD